jgi:hypothetical protein
LGSEATENVIEFRFCEVKFRWSICWQVQQDNAAPLWKDERVGRDGLTWLYEIAAWVEAARLTGIVEYA